MSSKSLIRPPKTTKSVFTLNVHTFNGRYRLLQPIPEALQRMCVLTSFRCSDGHSRGHNVLELNTKSSIGSYWNKLLSTSPADTLTGTYCPNQRQSQPQEPKEKFAIPSFPRTLSVAHISPNSSKAADMSSKHNFSRGDVLWGSSVV
jgi:hypothetical protein